MSSKDWYVKNKEHSLERSKKYYQDHREQQQARSNAYYHSNKKRILEVNKAKYHKRKNTPEFIAKVKLWRLNRRAGALAWGRTFKGRYSNAVSNAKKIGRVFEIDFKEYSFLIAKKCFYCGSSMCHETGTGLDRIDNLVGYELSNVLPCCGLCNRIRSDVFSVAEMKLLGKSIRRVLDARKGDGGK